MRFAVAGLAVDLRCATSGTAAAREVDEWLRPFVTTAPPAWRLRWDRTATGESAAAWPVEVVAEGDALRLRAPDFDARLDGASRRGHIRGWSLGSLASALLALLAREDQSVLPLHASAVRLAGGRVDVFCAPSRTGKTTLADGLGEVLADDVCLLRRGRSGWTVAGAPLWHGARRRGRLGTVHLLRHGPLARRRLAVRETLGRLLPETRLVLPATASRARALGLVGRLVEEAAVDELSFGLPDVPAGVRRICLEEGP